MTAAYDRLLARFARIATLGEAESVLDWDAAVIMSAEGGPARADQLALIAEIRHGLLTDAATADDLATAEAHPPATPRARANLALMARAHRKAVVVPADLVHARAHASSTCEKVWRRARTENDFALVAPHLAENIGLARHYAEALATALGTTPYDTLLDDFQQGLDSATLTPIFDRYETFLTAALPEAEALQAAAPAPLPLAGVFPVAQQEELCRSLVRGLGLGPGQTRLDQSTHPFCGGIPTDIRITTRYDHADPAGALLGVLHESGHALYEQGLPAADARQPVGAAAGMAAHESQSLIIEMQVCRSDAFLAWLGTRMHATFGGDAAPYAGANLARLWRRVERSLIRVDADELTYPAHVILRYRLEQALISAELSVSDLPGAWADGLHALLGVRPPDDRQGCLQDIHWFMGAFGYFPSYTIGAMTAAQLMAAVRRAVPALEPAVARGDLMPLLGWLRPNVHHRGSEVGLNDLLLDATGSVLDPSFFEAHLSQRYLSPAPR